MEPEGSLPQSQVPANCIYPGPARSSLCSHTSLPEDPSSYYPPIYTWVFQVVSLPQVSPPKPCICLSLNPNVLHPRPSHSSQFDHSNTTGWEVQIISHHNTRTKLCDFFTLEQAEKFRCCRNRGLSGSTTHEKSLSLPRYCAIGDFLCDASAAQTTCRILPQNTSNLLLKKKKD